MLRRAVLAVVGVSVLLGATPSGGEAASAAPPPGVPAASARLHSAGRWLVDGQGRAVILHGVNQVRKLPPFLPSAVGFGADDATAIAALGFNTVRTGVAQAGLAPAPGAYDGDYLADFAGTVRQLTAQHLYVLVDVHQDMYGPRYQGNGFAPWATVDSSPVEPTTLPVCANGFPANYFTCQPLWEAYDRFFGLSGRSPEVGPRGLTLEEEFADMWRPLASALRDDPYVFGFNLLNEPAPGSQILACLEPLGCPPETDAALTRFSNLVATAVRDVAPDTMVFYEPYATNFNAGFPTRHGDLDVEDVGFSFHVYACPFAIPGVPVPDPGLSDQCDTLREQDVFTNAEAQATAHGHTPLVTEFGATDDLGTIRRIADLADANMMGWQYWAWWNEDPCCERPDEGIIDDPANPPTPDHLDEPKLDALVRPFPRAVAGTPTGWHWDEDRREFTLAYTSAPVADALDPAAVTEIWIPARHFPEGYEVTVDGATVVSAPDAEALRLRTTPGAHDVSVTVVPRTSRTTAGDAPVASASPAVGPEEPATSPLPVTGGGLVTAALALLGGAGILRRRSRSA